MPFCQKSITIMGKKPSSTVQLRYPLTAFFLYRAEIYDYIKLENPTLKATELAILIGEMWKKSDSEIKAKYEEQCKAGRVIYDKANKAPIMKRRKLVEGKEFNAAKASKQTSAPTKPKLGEDAQRALWASAIID